MTYLIGAFVGGAIIIYLLSALIEWAVVKRVVDVPAAAITACTVLAMVLAIVLYGFGNADGGPWNPLPGGLAYVIAGAFVCFGRIALRRRKEAGAGARV